MRPANGAGKRENRSKRTVEELRREFAPAGVKINLTETLLDKARIVESNEIRMNGTLIDDLLAAVAVPTDCPSCRYACRGKYLLSCP